MPLEGVWGRRGSKYLAAEDERRSCARLAELMNREWMRMRAEWYH